MGMAESAFIATGTTRDKISFTEETGREDAIPEAKNVDDTERGDITRDARV